jgi:membrane protein implicated in regulation of membrane protease activity
MKHVAFLIAVLFFSMFGAAYNAGLTFGDIAPIFSNPYVALYTVVILGVAIFTAAAVYISRMPKKQNKKKEKKEKPRNDETYFKSPKGGEYRTEYY